MLRLEFRLETCIMPRTRVLGAKVRAQSRSVLRVRMPPHGMARNGNLESMDPVSGGKRIAFPYVLVVRRAESLHDMVVSKQVLPKRRKTISLKGKLERKIKPDGRTQPDLVLLCKAPITSSTCSGRVYSLDVRNGTCAGLRRDPADNISRSPRLERETRPRGSAVAPSGTFRNDPGREA